MKTWDTACGVTLAIASGLVGFVSAWLLGGLGICGFDLTGGMICFALAAAIILPATTVRFLPAPWWVPALVFCSIIPIDIPFQILGHEWFRATGRGVEEDKGIMIGFTESRRG